MHVIQIIVHSLSMHIISTQTLSHDIDMIIIINYSPPSILLLCIYPVQPVCTFLLILLLLSIRYTVLHILFYCTYYSFLFLFFTSFFSYLYLFKLSCVCVTYNRTVHGADLTYISLLVIICIIMYATYKILKMQCSASETTFFFAWHHQSLLDFKPSNQPPSLQCVTPFMIQWIAIG